MASGRSERRLAAIMFTDVVGYTEAMARDEALGVRARARHREAVRPLVERYSGEWIEETGDESLSLFASAVDAVNCALALQEQLADDPELRIRIGIHLGDTLLQDGRVYGDGVNVAARIRPLAEPGGICVSAELHHSVQNQPNVEARPLGEQELKGVSWPVAVFTVSGRPSPPRAQLSAPSTGWRRTVGWPAAALLLVAAGLAVWSLRSPIDEPPTIRSLAVLPLEDLSGDPNQAYFADGMTEALISNLARIASLGVVSRTTVRQYTGARRALPEIAAELGVDAVIEGTVLRAGDAVRITVQLVDARTDRHLWSRTYQRDLRDVLRLQSELAAAVAREIRLQIDPAERARLAEAPVVNPEAYDLYLRGSHLLAQEGASRHRRAVELLEHAVELDPDFARGWARLADGYT